MCDDQTQFDADQDAINRGISRRDLAKLTSAAALASVLPVPANAADVVEQDVIIPTPDGEADCYFVHPAEGAHAGVLMWPDILSLRPAARLVGKRLAQSGYSVLVVNPYYRSAKAPVVGPGASFRNPEVRNKVLPLARSLTAETNVTDANTFVAWLDAQDVVDTSRGVGTTGYCMGGPMVMRTAAAIPNRIKAGASFHGGGLVCDDEGSPHLLIPTMTASFLIAVASNDDEKEPDAKDVLRASFDAAGLDAEIEVYDALHGWCMPDSQVYDEPEAERAWARLLALFETALA